MRAKYLFCTIMITLATAATTYGAAYTAQTITITSESTAVSTAIEITDSKVITDSFSFKVPKGWEGNCMLVQNGTDLEFYNKSLYEADGSGLLFTIVTYEDLSYQDLTDYSILGFCGNKAYVLKNDYTCTFTDSSSAEYQACIEAVNILKKSFVSFIKDK